MFRALKSKVRPATGGKESQKLSTRDRRTKVALLLGSLLCIVLALNRFCAAIVLPGIMTATASGSPCYSEPTLISIAYGFEQHAHGWQPPQFLVTVIGKQVTAMGMGMLREKSLPNELRIDKSQLTVQENGDEETDEDICGSPERFALHDADDNHC